MKDRFLGMVQTVWSGTGQFLDDFYGNNETTVNTPANCFRALYSEIQKLSDSK